MNTRFSVPHEIAVRIRDWKTLDKPILALPIRALLEIGFHPLSSLRLAAPICTAEATIIQPAIASTADHPATKLGTCGKEYQAELARYGGERKSIITGPDSVFIPPPAHPNS